MAVRQCVKDNHKLFKSYVSKVTMPNEVGICEYGISRYRFDALLIKPHLRPSQRKIRIFEFKQDKRDFTGDKKWPEYLKYCNSFSFVCPQGLILPEELPKGVGLVWLYTIKSQPDKLTDFKWKKRPKLRAMQDPELFNRILSGMLIRAKYRRDDII